MVAACSIRQEDWTAFVIRTSPEMNLSHGTFSSRKMFKHLWLPTRITELLTSLAYGWCSGSPFRNIHWTGRWRSSSLQLRRLFVERRNDSRDLQMRMMCDTSYCTATMIFSCAKDTIRDSSGVLLLPAQPRIKVEGSINSVVPILLTFSHPSYLIVYPAEEWSNQQCSTSSALHASLSVNRSIHTMDLSYWSPSTLASSYSINGRALFLVSRWWCARLDCK